MVAGDLTSLALDALLERARPNARSWWARYGKRLLSLGTCAIIGLS
jgi:hypothetical protein